MICLHFKETCRLRDMYGYYVVSKAFELEPGLLADGSASLHPYPTSLSSVATSPKYSLGSPICRGARQNDFDGEPQEAEDRRHEASEWQQRHQQQSQQSQQIQQSQPQK